MDTFQINQLGDDFILHQLDSRKIKLTPLTMGGRARLQAMFANVVRTPISIAKEAAKGENSQITEHLLKEAAKLQVYFPPAIDSPDGLHVLSTNRDMQIQFLEEMIRKYQPNEVDTLPEILLESLTMMQFNEIGAYGWSGMRPDDPNFPMPALQPANQ